MKSYPIQCAIIRGGTTKGVYINTDQLPQDPRERDKIILTLFGSPDYRQINGLGGGDPLTSKVALISPSKEEGVDFYYQSGEVGIDEASINYSTMCGNLASGVGLFALKTKMISPQYPQTRLVIRNLNTQKIYQAFIPVDADLQVETLSSCKKIDGVETAGTHVRLRFLEPHGAITGHLLPGGQVTNLIEHNQTRYPCSIVDCGTLYAMFPAHVFGLDGSESPESLDDNLEFKMTIEELRQKVAQLISLKLEKNIQAKQIKMAIFSALAWPSMSNMTVTARVINRYKTHKAFPVTGAICFGAACIIPNTLLNMHNCEGKVEHCVKIFHPEGELITSSFFERRADEISMQYTEINRSSRILMLGEAEVFI
jgi:2-methylaconitate cis-trans-isomerase PrpF